MGEFVSLLLQLGEICHFHPLHFKICIFHPFVFPVSPNCSLHLLVGCTHLQVSPICRFHLVALVLCRDQRCLCSPTRHFHPTSMISFIRCATEMNFHPQFFALLFFPLQISFKDFTYLQLGVQIGISRILINILGSSHYDYQYRNVLVNPKIGRLIQNNTGYKNTGLTGITLADGREQKEMHCTYIYLGQILAPLRSSSITHVWTCDSRCSNRTMVNQFKGAHYVYCTLIAYLSLAQACPSVLLSNIWRSH